MASDPGSRPGRSISGQALFGAVQGAFQWPKITDGVMRMTAVQLAALVAGMEWTRVVSPRRTQTPKEVS